jgi:hypothetical protein
MKHYVTIKRTQKITYEIDAQNKNEAREMGLHLAEAETTPYDVSDAEFEAVSCITYTELLQYLRKQNNN